MAKRFMALLLALLLLLSLSACASAPAGSVESPSLSPAVAAEPSDSPALPEDIELGEVYDKSTVELPGNSVYLQDAVTTGSRLFLYGLDESQTPCFYIMDAGTRSIEPYAIDVPGSMPPSVRAAMTCRPCWQSTRPVKAFCTCSLTARRPAA